MTKMRLSRNMTIALFLRGLPVVADKCPCLIPDENNNCIDCGKHIEMPDVGCPDLGDIKGIIHLIDSTVKTYLRMVQDNTDPTNANQPRLRMVGGQMVRVPHKVLYNDLLVPSYQQAKTLGYRGTFERWGELLWESTPPNPDGTFLHLM